jgi:transposase
VDIVHCRCAGLDISKRDAKVCLRTQEPDRAKASSKVTTWAAVTSQILALREHLILERVTLVVMEATSDYWKPFYYVLEGGPFEVMLVNARHVKNLPGRKTDVSDAAWLAQLGAHGLVRASFVPPEPIRQLRDLTRTRTTIIRERTREIQRLEKLMEDTGVKLSSVATQMNGVSSRIILDALVAGERDPVVLADMAKGRLRSKIPELTEALAGRFSEHHAFLVQIQLDLIDQRAKAIDEITARIEVVMEPFRAARDLISTIPGISTRVADVIIAETGADMSRFPTAGHLASWAGVCPGSNESAGRVKSTRTRPGNPYLKGALGIAALAAARTHDTYYAAKFRRIASRRGPIKAVVALEHSMLITVWNMLQTGENFNEPGGDFYTNRSPEKAKRRAIDQLRNLGYTVTLEPTAA